MTVLGLAVAAAVATMPVKAEPTVSPDRWVRSSDISASDTTAAMTTFDLTIDQAGQSLKCDIVIPSGSDRLDAAVCAAVLKRARFKPARDASNVALHSVLRDRVSWQPYGSGENRWYADPDFVASTSALADGKRETVSVVEIISASGVVEECVASDASEIAELNELACAIVTRPDVALPITDTEGRPSRGLRSYIVGFVSGSDGNVVMR